MTNSKETKSEWVVSEEHDSSGKMIMPRKAIESTKAVQYDAKKHTDKFLRICTGYGPGQGVLIGHYKLYDIERFHQSGWRSKAQAVIHVEPYRLFEAHWFKAFKGWNVEIQDPGLPNLGSRTFTMKVIDTNFNKKIIHAQGKDEKVCEGLLVMEETWFSFLLRWDFDTKWIVATTIAVIGLAIAVLAYLA